MKPHKMDIWNGLIDFSHAYGWHQNALVICGRMLLSPNVKRGIIRTRISSQRFAPTMRYWSKKVKASLATQQERVLWRGIPHYRHEVSNLPVVNVDWAGNMICLNWRVSKVRLGTWRSICLRTQFSQQYGPKVGGVSAIRRIGLNFQK